MQRHRRGAVDPRLERQPHLGDGGRPSRLVHQPPARVGRAGAGVHLHQVRGDGGHRRDVRRGHRACSRPRVPMRGSRSSPREYLPADTVCARCGAGVDDLKPEDDIVDVWWESGVSHTSVLEERVELHRPAELYLEGSDQHRGWFQSSLLTSVGAYGVAPFKRVLTHGFIVDGDGRKMSKSLGNADLAARRHREVRRRHHPTVGRLVGLLAGRVGLRRDPRPDGRGVPPHPQHVPLPALEPRGFRSGDVAWRGRTCPSSTGSRSCSSPISPSA